MNNSLIRLFLERAFTIVSHSIAEILGRDVIDVLLCLALGLVRVDCVELYMTMIRSEQCINPCSYTYTSGLDFSVDESTRNSDTINEDDI